jgi:hypothetical protein
MKSAVTAALFQRIFQFRPDFVPAFAAEKQSAFEKAEGCAPWVPTPKWNRSS